MIGGLIVLGILICAVAWGGCRYWQGHRQAQGSAAEDGTGLPGTAVGSEEVMAVETTPKEEDSASFEMEDLEGKESLVRSVFISEKEGKRTRKRKR